MQKSDSLKELDKPTRTKSEITRLNKLFKDIEPNKLKTAKKLIENAAFMAITLDDLQTAMDKPGGIISKYQNGENQWGTKKSPEVDVYNTMIKNYASIIKQLIDLAPEAAGAGNDLLSYVTGGKK